MQLHKQLYDICDLLGRLSVTMLKMDKIRVTTKSTYNEKGAATMAFKRHSILFFFIIRPPKIVTGRSTMATMARTSPYHSSSPRSSLLVRFIPCRLRKPGPQFARPSQVRAALPLVATALAKCQLCSHSGPKHLSADFHRGLAVSVGCCVRAPWLAMLESMGRTVLGQ